MMIRKIMFLAGFFLLLPMFICAEEEGANNDELSAKEMKKETDSLTSKILEIESAIDDLNKEAVKEKDIRWKVCIDDSLASIKGVAASAVAAKTRLSELLEAEKKDDASGQLILLRGLTESAEKSMNNALSCERQLTRVSSDTETVVEVDKEKTGSVKEEGVNDAMGLGFSNEFVADGDKSVVSGSGLADAAGVAGSDVPGDSPEFEGGTSRSEKDSVEVVDVPENNEASPTR